MLNCEVTIVVGMLEYPLLNLFTLEAFLNRQVG